MEALGFPLREEVVHVLTEDVLKSSEIEGEVLDREQVRSSIARRLGMDIAGLVSADRHVEGVVEMMLDATQNYKQPLTAERLFGWHAALFPAGRSGMSRIAVGAWRTPEAGIASFARPVEPQGDLFGAVPSQMCLCLPSIAFSVARSAGSMTRPRTVPDVISPRCREDQALSCAP